MSVVFVGITAVVGAAVVGVCPATVVLRQEHDGRREKTCVRPPFVAQDYRSLLQGTLSIALKDIFLAAYNRNGLRWEVLLCRPHVWDGNRKRCERRRQGSHSFVG